MDKGYSGFHDIFSYLFIVYEYFLGLTYGAPHINFLADLQTVNEVAHLTKLILLHH